MAEPEQAGLPARWWGAVALILTVGVLAYHNSLTAPFLLDDQISIVDDPAIHRLWPLWPLLAGTERPVVDLTFAINYALGGVSVWGYHVVNLIIHVIAALLLFGLVRRTLESPPLRERFGASSTGLALAVSVLWVVHPLNTQSVTYIVQRAESLMGLCVLLSLYALARSADSPHPARWEAAAAAACALGMGVKAVTVVTPIIALCYDRAFLSPSVREALRRRGGLYLALAAGWVWLAVLLASTPHIEASAGFGLQKVTPWQYLRTQPGVILHYLRLAAWPHPLVLDYGWPVAKTFGSVVVPATIVGGLLAAAIRTWRRSPALGFGGLWFFLALAPTSSVIPISDLAFEYRMYVPLAALLCVVAAAAHQLLAARLPDPRVRILSGSVLALAVAAAFTRTTVQRNRDYQDAAGMWREVVRLRPDNPRGHNNLGVTLADEGRIEEAISHYTRALALKPDFAHAHNNWGMALAQADRPHEAAEHFREALRLRPGYVEAHISLGAVLAKQGRLDEAIEQYRAALKRSPKSVKAMSNLGAALAEQGHLDEAIQMYQQALRLQPDAPEIRHNLKLAMSGSGRAAPGESAGELGPGETADSPQAVEAMADRAEMSAAEAHNNLAVQLSRDGQLEEAEEHYRQALALNPSLMEAHYNFGNLLARQGRFEEAAKEYKQALRLSPDSAPARHNLARALAGQGRLEEAVAAYRDALRLSPDSPEAQNNLGLALRQQGNAAEARACFEAALRLRPDYAKALYNLGTLAADEGRSEEAVAHLSKALQLNPGFREAQEALIRIRLVQLEHRDREASAGGTEAAGQAQPPAGPGAGP